MKCEYCDRGVADVAQPLRCGSTLRVNVEADSYQNRTPRLIVLVGSSVYLCSLALRTSHYDQLKLTHVCYTQISRLGISFDLQSKFVPSDTLGISTLQVV